MLIVQSFVKILCLCKQIHLFTYINILKQSVCLLYSGAHVLGQNQWAYNDELADMCEKQRIPEYVRMLYDLCHHRRLYNLLHYKEDEFEMSEKGHYYRREDADSNS